MQINKDFIKRRWLEYRQGHSTYLIFTMAFAQFTIITYALAIERLPVLREIFPSMISWIVFFLAIYVPSAIIVGHWHVNKIVPHEARNFHDKNPFTNYAAPGKELLLNIPAAIVAYQNQLKGMRIHNQVADAWHAQYGITIEKWESKDFADVEQVLDKHVRMGRGESIADITR